MDTCPKAGPECVARFPLQVEVPRLWGLRRDERVGSDQAAMTQTLPQAQDDSRQPAFQKRIPVLRRDCYCYWPRALSLCSEIELWAWNMVPIGNWSGASVPIRERERVPNMMLELEASSPYDVLGKRSFLGQIWDSSLKHS